MSGWRTHRLCHPAGTRTRRCSNARKRASFRGRGSSWAAPIRWHRRAITSRRASATSRSSSCAARTSGCARCRTSAATAPARSRRAKASGKPFSAAITAGRTRSTGACSATPEFDGVECFSKEANCLPRVQSRVVERARLREPRPRLPSRSTDFLEDLPPSVATRRHGRASASPRERTGTSTVTGRSTSITISRATTSPSCTRRCSASSITRSTARRRSGTTRSSIAR